MVIVLCVAHESDDELDIQLCKTTLLGLPVDLTELGVRNPTLSFIEFLTKSGRTGPNRYCWLTRNS
jgi:hypothetical protein